MTPRNIQCTAILVVLVGYADYMNKPQLQESRGNFLNLHQNFGNTTWYISLRAFKASSIEKYMISMLIT